MDNNNFDFNFDFDFGNIPVDDIEEEISKPELQEDAQEGSLESLILNNEKELDKEKKMEEERQNAIQEEVTFPNIDDISDVAQTEEVEEETSTKNSKVTVDENKKEDSIDELEKELDEEITKEETKPKKTRRTAKKKDEQKIEKKEIDLDYVEGITNEEEPSDVPKKATQKNTSQTHISPNEIKLPNDLVVKIYGTELFNTSDECNTIASVRSKLIELGYTEFKDEKTSGLVIKDKFIIDNIVFQAKG